MSRTATLLAFTVVVMAPVRGQQTTATIVGKVTDSSGAVVTRAPVVVIEEKTNRTIKMVSNEVGDYTAPSLSPGAYTIRVENPGFRTATISGVRIATAQTLRVDVRLEPGNVTESIEVRDAQPVVQSESSHISDIVDNRRILQMPLNGRDSVGALLALAAGVQAGQTGPTPSGSPLIAGNASIAGANFSIDGIGNNDDQVGRAGPDFPSFDAIEEFNVIANLAPAQYGHAGSQILITTKSGSNDFHGALFYFNRNRALNAKNFFATGLPKPPFNRHEFGANSGGRIRRDKTFYFAAFEKLQFNSSRTAYNAVPTQALRDGNFTGLPAITDPFGGAPFPGNRIPDSRISGIPKKLQSFYPLPNVPVANPAGLGLNQVNNVPTEQINTRTSARITHLLTKSDRVNGLYSRTDNGPYLNSGSFPTMGGYLCCDATQMVEGDYTRVFGPAVVNEFRGGYRKLKFYRRPQNRDIQPSTIVPGIPPQATGGIPGASIANFAGIGDFGSIANHAERTIWQIADNLTAMRGVHTVKLGGEVSRFGVFQSANNIAFAPYGATFAFNGRYTGNSYADFLLGYSTGNRRSTPPPDRHNRQWLLAPYAQDDWKVSPRLTLNIGLRYEFNGVVNERDGNVVAFDPAAGRMVTATRNGGFPVAADKDLLARFPIVTASAAGLPDDLYKPSHVLNPRVGFAFRPLGNNTMVIRGGYGLFDYYINSNILDAGNIPYLRAETFEQPAGPVPTITWADPFPGGLAALPSYPGFNVVAFEWRVSIVQQWNFTIERQVLAKTSVRLSYNGVKADRLRRNYDLNTPVPAPGPENPRRPYQPFGPITYYDYGGSQIAHSAQLELNRRVTEGLNLQVNYQVVRALNDTDARADIRNFRADRGNQAGLRNHVLYMNALYDVPLRVEGKAAKALATGWVVGGIATMQSGVPFTPSFVQRVQGAPGGRPDRVPGVDPYGVAGGQSIEGWFNPLAFMVPAPFAFGNAQPNLLFGPGLSSVDLAVYKNVPIRERVTAQVRAESFNLLNHPSFGLPSANISDLATVGRIRSASTQPRSVQFGLRLTF